MTKKANGQHPPEGDWSIEEFLDGYEPPEETVPIPMAGKLIGQLTELEEELEAAQRQQSDSIDGGSDVLAIAQKIVDVQEQVKASERKFHLRAIDDWAWGELVDAHPPTDEYRAKQPGAQWNPETFAPAAIAATCVTPKMTPAQVERLLKTIAPRHVRRLFDATLVLNAGRGDDIPKSGAASVLRRASERSSTTAGL